MSDFGHDSKNNRRRQPWTAVVGGVAIATAAFTVGHLTAEGADDFRAGAAEEVPGPYSDEQVRDGPRALQRDSLGCEVATKAGPTGHRSASIPADDATVLDAGVNTNEQRPLPQIRARRQISSLLRRVDATRLLLRDADTETRINHLNYYYDGVADAFLASVTEADYLALSQDLEERLCRPGIDLVEEAALLRLMQPMPNVANERILDCVLSRPREEDLGLHWALDLWHRANLPPSEAYTRWQYDARDPRTVRRFTVSRGRDPNHFSE